MDSEGGEKQALSELDLLASLIHRHQKRQAFEKLSQEADVCGRKFLG
jgi:hypothetical protein